FLNQSGNPFLYGKGVGTMYEIDLFPPTGHINMGLPHSPAAGTITAACEARTTVLAFATHSLNKPADIDTWHRRLGHPSYDTVERMGRKEIVGGMDVTTFSRQPGLCEDCVMGKQTRCPFDGNSRPVTE